MTKTVNEDGTTDLYAEGEMRLRVKGSDDAAGVESVHLSRWASPDDWEEFAPPADEKVEAILASCVAQETAL
jgi:hypothetical protein